LNKDLFIKKSMIASQNVFKYRIDGYKSKFVNARNGSRLTTASFSPLFDEAIKFSLCIGLRTKSHHGSVSLFLVLSGLGEKNRVDVCFKFWIEDRGGNRYLESSVLRQTFDARNDKFGFHDYQKRATLMDKKFKRFSDENGFFICCDVRPGNQIGTMNEPMIQPPIPAGQTEPPVVVPTPRKRKADDTSTVNLPYGESEMNGQRSLPAEKRPSLFRVATFQQSSIPKTTSSTPNAPLSLSSLPDSTIRQMVWNLYLEGSHDAIINVDGTKFKVNSYYYSLQTSIFRFSSTFSHFNQDSSTAYSHLMIQKWKLSMSKMSLSPKWDL